MLVRQKKKDKIAVSLASTGFKGSKKQKKNRICFLLIKLRRFASLHLKTQNPKPKGKVKTKGDKSPYPFALLTYGARANATHFLQQKKADIMTPTNKQKA